MDRLCFHPVEFRYPPQGCWLKKNLISWYRKMSANVTAMVNGTQSMSSCFNPTARRIGGTFAYCLLFVVSLAANTFIGIIVYRTKTMRTPINILIVNMALSDLLYPIFLFPKIFVELNTAGHWLVGGPLGHAACKLSSFAADVSTLVSIQSLLLIAVDRFVAVVFPLRSPLISSKQCRYFILVIWIVAMAVHCPYLIAFKVLEYSEGLFCRWQRNDIFGESLSQQTYILGLIVVTIYVPLVLISILYFVISLKIKSQKIPGKQSANARERRLKKERNVLNMSVAIVLVFAVCWLPLSIYALLFLYSSNIAIWSSCGMQYFGTIAFLLARSYCAVNPCICFIFSGNYRQGLKNLFGCFPTGEAA
nr:RYamide receptor-like [Pocillopora verrucosa]